MGRFRASAGDDGNEPGIDMSPLIDCVFILLIFFIVTTVFVEETGVEVDKPQAASASNLEKNSILIALTVKGEVVYGEREIKVSGVRPLVKRMAAEGEGDPGHHPSRSRREVRHPRAHHRSGQARRCAEGEHRDQGWTGLGGEMPSFLHHGLVLFGASVLTLTCFLVLPLIQAITNSGKRDLIVRSSETVALPPPPSVDEPEPEKEPEPEEDPPEMEEEIQPLDLSQLELALNPGGFGDGWSTASFEIKIGTEDGGGDAADALFSLSDLDQKPRAIYQPGPIIDDKVRRKAPGQVSVVFVVNARGKVEDPIVQASSDPVFVAPALAAIRKWKFEPGQRNGKAVRIRMRVPITFPKGL